jgi:acetyltransferase-like isoleucine patch superfamily enzyme
MDTMGDVAVAPAKRRAARPWRLRIGYESPFTGLKNRVLQLLARVAPGAMTLRVALHRWRGVKIGKRVWIGYDAIIETSRPHLVAIGDDVVIGIRATLIAHFREVRGLTIENQVSIGPGVIVMPGVTIGEGSVVTAGSVVTRSVPAMTVVQGNPAKPVARVGVPLMPDVSVKKFSSNLRPIDRRM